MGWAPPRLTSITMAGRTFTSRVTLRPACSIATIMTARSLSRVSLPVAPLTKMARPCPGWVSGLATTMATAGSISSGLISPTRSQRFIETTGTARSMTPVLRPAWELIESISASARLSSTSIMTDGRTSSSQTVTSMRRLPAGNCISLINSREYSTATSRGRFQDVSKSAGSGITAAHVGRGCAFGDLDNDGDLEVVVNNQDGPPSILRNDGGNQNNFVSIKCIGTRSNRSAIGARVKVTANGREQIDEVMSGSSYYSHNDFRLHFGLGTAEKADNIEILWPSGLKENIANIKANQFIVIEESKGVVKRDDRKLTRRT